MLRAKQKRWVWFALTPGYLLGISQLTYMGLMDGKWTIGDSALWLIGLTYVFGWVFLKPRVHE